MKKITQIIKALETMDDMTFVNIYNSYVRKKDNKYIYPEIMPNEEEFVNEYFRVDSPWTILSQIDPDYGNYQSSDKWFIVDSVLKSDNNPRNLFDTREEETIKALIAKYYVEKTNDPKAENIVKKLVDFYAKLT